MDRAEKLEVIAKALRETLRGIRSIRDLLDVLDINREVEVTKSLHRKIDDLDIEFWVDPEAGTIDFRLVDEHGWGTTQRFDFNELL